MLQLQCPKCGTIATKGEHGFPQRRRCGEYLKKCRYCFSFDRKTWECTDLKVPAFESAEGGISRRVKEPNAITSCIYYDSRLRVVEKPPSYPQYALRFMLLSAPLVGLALLTTLIVIRLVSWSVAEVGPKQMRLGVIHPQEVDTGVPMTMYLRVTNLDRWKGEAAVIRIPQRFFRGFRLLRFSPVPDDMFISGTGRYFFYNKIPPNAFTLIEMTVMPTRVGMHWVDIALYSEDGMLLEKKRCQFTAL